MNINEIEQKSFDKSIGRGYRVEDVDTFKHDVCEYIKTLINEKSDLFKKLEVLAHKVEEYKKDEESIREALLGAQKLGKTVLNEANEKADNLVRSSEEKSQEMLGQATAQSQKILTEARTVSDSIISKAKTESDKLLADTKQSVEVTLRNCKYEIEKEQNLLARTQKESSKFKTELLDLYRQHIDLIKKIPESENIDLRIEKETKELDKKIYEQKVEEQKIVEEADLKTATEEEKIEVVVEVNQPDTISETQVISEGLNVIKSQETKEYSADDVKGSFVPNPPKAATPQQPIVNADGTKYSKKFGELDFGKQGSQKK